MDFSGIVSHFRTPQLGFQVFHYSNDISNPNALPMAHNIEIFGNLEQAQVGAQSELARILEFYLNQGHYGRCFNEMNLSLRGLITAYVDSLHDSGRLVWRELILSKFHIVIVDVWDPSWAVDESNMQAHGVVIPTREPSTHKCPSELNPIFFPAQQRTFIKISKISHPTICSSRRRPLASTRRPILHSMNELFATKVDTCCHNMPGE